MVALSTKVRVPMRIPAAVGLKVTEILHLAPAPKLVPQVFVSAKSLGFAPASVMLVMFKDVLPELVTERFSGPPVVPTS